jgi:hypothetical protein
LIISITGCVRAIVLHPIDRLDIIKVEKGATIMYPNSTIDKIDRNGYFVSEYYIDEIMKIRIDQTQ